MARPSKYSPELRERAVRMVQEHSHEYPSQWAAIRSIGEKLACTTRCCGAGCARPSGTRASARA